MSIGLDYFEAFINLFQSFAVTHYLIGCFGAKNKRKRPYVEYIVGIVITFIYLEVLNRITVFENIGVFAFLVISIFFTVYLLDGDLIEKIFYNVVMIVIIVLSTMSGAGIVSVLTGVSYNELVTSETKERYLALVAVQIVLSLFLFLVTKIKHIIKSYDKRYLKTLIIIPIVSVIVCCVLFFGIRTMSYRVRNLISFLGILIINIVSLYLLIVEHKLYEQHLQEENLISAYVQKEKDVEAIKAMKLDMEKLQHDNKNIYILLQNLMNNGEYEEAKKFLGQYIEEKNIDSNSLIYCDNIILNYLLNRKRVQCDEKGLSFKCFVNGIIDGVLDVDLYILLENLLDNAIEAAMVTPDKRVDIDLSASQQHINIDVGNSVNDRIQLDINNVKSSKKDKKRHGYGLKNVNDVVKKYGGSIKYDMRIDRYIKCSVILNKSTK